MKPYLVLLCFAAILGVSGNISESQGIGFSALQYFEEKYTSLYAEAFLKFETVVTSLGGAYNSTSGIFTAPSDGHYVFTFFHGSRRHSGLYMAVVVNNDNNKCTTQASEDHPGRCTAFVHLRQGDLVRVKNYLKTGVVRMTMLFTGFMLNSSDSASQNKLPSFHEMLELCQTNLTQNLEVHEANLTQELDLYKANLAQDLDLYKANLAQELDLYKAKADQALIKADLTVTQLNHALVKSDQALAKANEAIQLAMVNNKTSEQEAMLYAVVKDVNRIKDQIDRIEHP